MEFTGYLRGTHLHLTLVAEDGTEGEATVHLEQGGHLGVSSPFWADPRAVAAMASGLAGPHLSHIESAAHDPSQWAAPAQTQ